MIVFKTIRWKNFLSTGNQFTEISLTDTKSSLIVGANGAGKSTILDALTFALFGKPFRKINKPQLLNSINQSDCVVEVNFDIGRNKYTVTRGIKPTKFEIYQNGALLDRDSLRLWCLGHLPSCRLCVFHWQLVEKSLKTSLTFKSSQL